MAFTLNDNIPCGTEACATSKHEGSACNSVDNVLISGIKDIKKGISDIDSKLDNLNVDVDLTPVAKEETLIAESQSIKDKIDAIPATDLSPLAKEETLVAESQATKNRIDEIREFFGLSDSLPLDYSIATPQEIMQAARDTMAIIFNLTPDEAIEMLPSSVVVDGVKYEMYNIDGYLSVDAKLDEDGHVDVSQANLHIIEGGYEVVDKITKKGDFVSIEGVDIY
jgi:hypothetical protein